MTASGRRDIRSSFGSLVIALLYSFVLVISTLAHTESIEVVIVPYGPPVLDEANNSSGPGYPEFEEDPNLCPVCIFQAMGSLTPALLDSPELCLTPESLAHVQSPKMIRGRLVYETRTRSPPAFV